jgi:dGTPase
VHLLKIWRELREELEENLSIYAAKATASKGRQIFEEECPVRTIYERDGNRILHSEEFRRLRHKTQVFFNAKNDHICTRMEHVLHVSSISCTIARTLGLNQDLTNAIALGHDLGHAPFGHTGEKVLRKCVKDIDKNNDFQHELHSLRVVDRLATRFTNENKVKLGLNLSYEVRDGIVSHCGEKYNEHQLFRDVNKRPEDIYLCNHRNMYPYTLEAGIVRLVDKIAYVGRDIEDAVRAGLIDFNDISREVIDVLGRTNGEIINNLVVDIIENSYNQDVIQLSDEKGQALKQMIHENVRLIYQSDKIRRYEKNTENMLEGIFFSLYEALSDPEKIKNSKTKVFRNLADFIISKNYNADESKAQIVVDYIAGMTDNYAMKCYEELYWF